MAESKTSVQLLRHPAQPALIGDWPELIGRVYAHRKLKHTLELDYSLQHLIPANLLLNIDVAVTLLLQAVSEQQRILIIGDYDCDGATSCALMVRGLRDFGVNNVNYLVPNRFDYGYGLTPEIVEVAAQQKPDLIITVDNGISSISGVKLAKQLGIKVLITDHHLPGAELPDADALINPNQVGDEFPSKCAAGVCVAFYLLSALRQGLREAGWFNSEAQIPKLAKYLDLVALGTVADVVPLDYNNRILVDQGLRRIRAGVCVPGITALLQCAEKNQTMVCSSDLGFVIGPRINAAGRMDDMTVGIECLLADDESKAMQLAQQLDALNRERKQVTTDMTAQGLAVVERAFPRNEDLPAGVCLFDQQWHAGVVGILAARVREQVNRPVIAFALDDEQTLKGSARSIPGLHIRDVLVRIDALKPGLIEKFGGHAMAAGLSLPRARFDEFNVMFAQTVLDFLGGSVPAACLYSDGEIPAQSLNLDLALSLRNAGPWGQGFEEPLFDGQFSLLSQRLLANAHLKMQVSANGSNGPIEAICFNFGDQLLDPEVKLLHLAYRVDVNYFRERQSLQLRVEHLRPC